MVTHEKVKVADQVWIALALLTREHPDREGFTPGEIINRVRVEFGHVSPGVPINVGQHCVATTRPNPGRPRLITKTPTGLDRLFRPGDPYHPDREGSKTKPERSDIPSRYWELLDWYDASCGSTLNEFGPEFLELGPWDSGFHDIAERHDYYLSHDPDEPQES